MIMLFGRGKELFQLQFLKIAEKASDWMTVGLVSTVTSRLHSNSMVVVDVGGKGSNSWKSVHFPEMRELTW